MSKAMIITIGAQGEQIDFSISSLKPEYLGLIATDTDACKKTLEDLLKKHIYPATRCKVQYVKDSPTEIGNLVREFRRLFDWLTQNEQIPVREISVDPTGGRKWMSSGATMIASFLGLPLIYVDVVFNDKKPDPATMKIVEMGNAYEQVGFIEEGNADKLFNEGSFSAAVSLYNNLIEKISDPRRIEIKKLLSEGFLYWTQFQFKKAYDVLIEVHNKISQFQKLTNLSPAVNRYCEILAVLKKNDAPDVKYIDLLQDDLFVENVSLTLTAQSLRYAKVNYFDQAVILLYRVLELISQFRLAKHGIDTGSISTELREKYNPEFKKMTKELFQGESEIPDKVALVHGWILLFCLKDDIIEGESDKFLKGLRGQTQTRDLLWIEHNNKSVKKEQYEKFRDFVYHAVDKLKIDFQKKMR